MRQIKNLLIEIIQIGNAILKELKVLNGTPAQSQIGELIQFALT